MIAADSDVLIDFLHDQGEAEAVASLLESGQLVTTAISRFELMSGARTEQQLEAASVLLAALPTLTLDDRAADRAALVRRELDASGFTIGMADSLIAGIVLERKLELLTRNMKHFARVRGLGLYSR